MLPSPWTLRIFVRLRCRSAMQPTLGLMVQTVGGSSTLPRCVELKAEIVKRYVSLSRLV